MFVKGGCVCVCEGVCVCVFVKGGCVFVNGWVCVCVCVCLPYPSMPAFACNSGCTRLVYGGKKIGYYAIV